MLSRPAHSLSASDITKELDADTSKGLAQAEATERLAKYGRNELEKVGGVHPFKILVRQIANAMTMVNICSFVRKLVNNRNRGTHPSNGRELRNRLMD